ncbi:MAG: hypothetical protein M1819_001709 [Sarea resinae]|nr:MAG: hypothetical protein M1819_001709 [Sarea resinae]
MAVGYNRPLEWNDIPLVNPKRCASPMSSRFKKSFTARVQRGDRYPLVWAFHDIFMREFWIGGICRLFSDILSVLAPFTLRYLIQFATTTYNAHKDQQTPPAIGKGVGLAIGITLMLIVQSLGTNHYTYRSMMVGAQSRAVLISVIFEKSFRISGRAKAGGVINSQLIPKRNGSGRRARRHQLNHAKDAGLGWGNGRIMNLMSTDSYRIDQACGNFHQMWTAPIAVLLTLALLIVNITYSALAGFGLVFLALPLITRALKALLRRRKSINKITDQRISLTQEILQAIKFVKYFGWEQSFLARLGNVRKQEVAGLQRLLTTRVTVHTCALSLPMFASMLSFITYALTSHSLHASRVFSSLALFNCLRNQLTQLPIAISRVLDAWSSIGRIQEYLNSEERANDVAIDEKMTNLVDIRHASFTWESNDAGAGAAAKMVSQQEKIVDEKNTGEPHKGYTGEESSQNTSDVETIRKRSTNADYFAEKAGHSFKLLDMDFLVGRAELLAVIGTVGCGKSSLLAALAGDMRKTAGEALIGASRALCPQYPWLQNATVRDNILFGKTFDPEHYRNVIDACALQADLDIFPHGDLTEIGERGITISGGQKQRLNVARAIYSGADIILMDDPLSAVDAHVGRHIFDQAIMGLLRGKSRILATHQVHVLSRCDRVLWLQDGRIQALDTYERLLANNKGFAKLMTSTVQEDEEEKAPAKANEKQQDGEKSPVEPTAGLMRLEERAVKAIPWKVYKDYILASGSILNAPFLIIILVVAQCAQLATNLWLSVWTSGDFDLSMNQYIGVYVGLAMFQLFAYFAFGFGISIAGTRASKAFYVRAINRVLHAPMSFFETTPMGRILNRFAKDVDTMDNNLVDSMRIFFMTIVGIVAVFILTIVFYYYFAIAIVPSIMIFVFVSGYYRASAREMKRHEAVQRSNMFARFGEALAGVACIRAYNVQHAFVKELEEAIDSMNSAYYLTVANQRWLTFRLDCVGNLLVFVTGILVATSKINVSPSIAGVILSSVLPVVQLMQATVRQFAEVENSMNATERLHYYYTTLEEEGTGVGAEAEDSPREPIKAPPSSWPEEGAIAFNKVQMRYRDGLPLILRDLTLNVRPGEHVGVVGRTGAGKSTIMSALFRLIEPAAGTITIDDIDISTIPLSDLRERLTIIPQDPTLFKGTIRSNLDPFNQHTDLELWNALRKANLLPADGGNPSDSDSNNTLASSSQSSPTQRIHLETPVSEEGLNFSLGQRQLLALARALIRNTRIIVADEATSSVDMDTDLVIQRTMATAFRDNTLIVIAHRLRTIVGYDRVIVIEEGKVGEQGTPKELWEAGGVFRKMCEKSGIGRAGFSSGAR